MSFSFIIIFLLLKMIFFSQKIKNSFFCCRYYSQNPTPQFHTNFFSKEYFPIYVSFAFYSIVYIAQYVIYGLLWERIIFNIALGIGFAITIYLANKCEKYTQLLFTMFFMFGTFLLDKFIIRGLKNDEMLFLGIYVCIIYYNMIKGSNNILSNFAFFFMLMYLSGVLLTSNLENLTTFFGNFTTCLLQSYLTWTAHKHKILEDEKLINEKKMWMHIFNKIFPGVTLLFKKKNCDNQNNRRNSKPSLRDLFQIEFVNIRGQEKYKLEKEYGDIEEFLSNIIIITDKRQQSSIKNDEIIIHDKFKEKYSENIFTLKDLIIDSSTENFSQISSENIVLGVYKDNSKKMKINLANFEWNSEKMLILNLDDENLEEVIKKLQENDVKKNELLASVTHDLRSPLNGMLAFVNNAKNNENKNDREKMLHYAEINGKLLMSLINDILDYSSFLNDKFNLIKESFSLDNLITEVIDLMAVQASAKNIKLRVEKEIAENIQLVSDSRRIKQILINLIGNSIKFTRQGYIKLKINQTKYKNILKFSVIDSGVGIKKETLDKLCTPYATFDTEPGLNKYGIGLGLSICKKLISLLGPNEIMNITSEYMTGTKVSFFIFLDVNNRNQIYDKLFSTNNKDFERKQYDFRRRKYGPKRILTNLPPKSTKYLKNERNSPLSKSVIVKKSQTFSDIGFNLNFFSKIEQPKKREFSIESQKLEFSSFGSMSNISDFEERLTSDNNNQPLNFLNIFQLEKKSIILPLKAFRVLIVDDNPFNIFVITAYFNKIKNFKLYYDNACNGDEAICKFKEKNKINSNEYYNLIFMDCLMPIKNGYEASFEIKSLIGSKKYYNSVIIGVTGLSGDNEEKKCFENGMDQFIAKPISEQQCFDIIYLYANKES